LTPMTAAQDATHTPKHTHRQRRVGVHNGSYLFELLHACSGLDVLLVHCRALGVVNNCPQVVEQTLERLEIFEKLHREREGGRERQRGGE
jgi:hypothetical protein